MKNRLRLKKKTSITNTNPRKSVRLKEITKNTTADNSPCYLIASFNTSSSTPHIKLLLPALSQIPELVTSVTWAKKEGDKVNKGDELVHITMDQAIRSYLTPHDGYLAKIEFRPGTEDIPLGRILCIIVENEADKEQLLEVDGNITEETPDTVFLPPLTNQFSSKEATSPSEHSDTRDLCPTGTNDLQPSISFPTIGDRTWVIEEQNGEMRTSCEDKMNTKLDTPSKEPTTAKAASGTVGAV